MAERPSTLQRIAGALARRADGPAAPPAARPQRRGFRKRLDSIRNNWLGIGSDDKISATRPDPYRWPLEYDELTSLYRYGGHSRRYVEVVPNDATKGGWKLQAAGDVVAEIDDEHKRLALFSNVCAADTWGRLYGGALILMITVEDWKGTPFEVQQRGRLAQPLDPARVLELKNLVVLDRSEFIPTTIDTDIESPTFRRPLKYRINANVGGVGAYVTGAEVHASRALYFDGAALPPSVQYTNEGCGDSILQSVWDQIRNMTTLSHGLAVLGAEMRISVLKMRDLADVSVSDQADAFDLRMRLLQRSKSMLNTVLLGDGEEYDHKQGTVAGMSELSDVTRKDLQAVTGMPEQLWIGTAPGGLNTDGDSHRQLWAKIISAYQTVKYEPVLTKFYDVLFAARNGPWAGVPPENWTLTFEPLDELTSIGIAELRNKQADLDVKHIASGVLDPERVAEARYGAKGWQDDIPAVDDEIPGMGLDLAGILAAIEGGTAAGGVPGEPGAEPTDVAATAMNGAQAAALQGMIEAAGSGAIPVGALAPMIRASFPLLDQAIIDAIVSSFAPPPPLPGSPESTSDDEGEPQLSAAETLAAMLTEHQVARCEHGSLNRCRLCGIERERALQLNENGAPMLDAEGNPMWALRWTAIGSSPTSPAASAAPTTSIKIDSKSIRVYIHELAARHGDRHRHLPVSRTDAADGLVPVWVGLPLPDEAMAAWKSARLEAAVIAGVTTDELDDRGHDPHVTLFWLGKVPATDAAAVGARAADVLDKLLSVSTTSGIDRASDFRAVELQGSGLSAFPPSAGSEGDTPMVLSLASDALFALNKQLADELLDQDERATRHWFTPHATVGYFAGDLSQEQWAQVYNWRGGRGTWTAGTVELHVGGETAGRWLLADRGT